MNRIHILFMVLIICLRCSSSCLLLFLLLLLLLLLSSSRRILLDSNNQQARNKAAADTCIIDERPLALIQSLTTKIYLSHNFVISKPFHQMDNDIIQISLTKRPILMTTYYFYVTGIIKKQTTSNDFQ